MLYLVLVSGLILVGSAVNNELSNEEFVKQLNAAYDGQAEFELGPFGFQTWEEFKKTKTLPPKPAPKFPRERYLSEGFLKTLTGNETSWDWRDHGAVTNVKDQGAVGCCYAMAAVASMEGQSFLSGKPLESFSVEHIIDCDYLDCGMFGGWPHQVYEYTIKNGGLPSWDDKPCCTCLGTGACFPCAPNKNTTQCGPPPSYCNQTWTDMQCDSKLWTPAVTMSDWKAVSTDEDQIAKALTALGPFAVAIDATRQLMHYKKGVLDPKKTGLGHCKDDVKELNHAVTLVGFGEENNVPYWLIKNSWGTKWGEKGYFKLRRGIGACGVNDTVTMAVL